MSAPLIAGLAALVCGGGLLAAAALFWPRVSRGRRRAGVPVAAAAAPADLADAAALDFFYCPGEGRRRPHAVNADGSRRCWNCGRETAGERA